VVKATRRKLGHGWLSGVRLACIIAQARLNTLAAAAQPVADRQAQSWRAVNIRLGGWNGGLNKPFSP